MDQQKNSAFIHTLWDQSIIPALMEYIRIPNKSPLYDSHWQEHGYMEQAIDLMTRWCHNQAIPGMQLDVLRLEGRTPVILIDIPGQSNNTILLYGHLDKQPEMSGWDNDLDPWKPVLKNEKLYGRGAADDGYALFAAFSAIKSLQNQKIPHARCVILIEACEESGSYDLPYYMNAFEKRIGSPKLVICLDSGCGNYDQWWISTSLRGLVGGLLQINVLKEGVHSGLGSGIVPSCFMILCQLLNRIEDESNGQIQLPDLFVDIPEERLLQAKKTATILGANIYQSLPFEKQVKPLTMDVTEQVLNRTWRPALSVIGSDGIPKTSSAGNVTLPSLTIKLSMRLPPTCDATKAETILKQTLESHPPYGAHVTFTITESATGWNAPKEHPWLTHATNQASEQYFGKEAMHIGEGGSIPFMAMLGKKFPEAQFLITGVLGPESNAHGPNEFLHIPTAKKLTCCIAEIIAKQYENDT